MPDTIDILIIGGGAAGFFTAINAAEKRKYVCTVIQIDSESDNIIGGETFVINKQPREGFLANAGENKEIEKYETINIQAEDINEDAVYNWYNMEGSLIYTGTDMTVSPGFTQTYKLEVISNLDGLKDYSVIEVKVNPLNKLQNLVPNPATTGVTINYIADDASSAYLMIVNQTTGSSDNYILDINQNTINIDLFLFSAGLYSVILVCDGEIQDHKNLVKQ